MKNDRSNNTGAKTSTDVEGEHRLFNRENGAAIGVAALVVALPETSFGLYGALIPMVVFGASVLIGAGIGWAVYYLKWRAVEQGGDQPRHRAYSHSSVAPIRPTA